MSARIGSLAIAGIDAARKECVVKRKAERAVPRRRADLPPEQARTFVAYRDLLQFLPLPLQIIDENGQVLFANHMISELTGQPMEDKMFGSTQTAESGQCRESPLAPPLVLADTAHRQSRLLGGHIHTVHRTALTLQHQVVVLEVFSPIEFSADQNDEVSVLLRAQAHHDDLTGLPSRKLLLDRLRGAIEERTKAMTLLFLDLDDFKRVNDNFGHRCGDEVLIQISRRIVSSVRQRDIVARYGGDEFVVILPGLSLGARVDEIARRVLVATSRPISTAGTDLTVTASLGIAALGDDDLDADFLVNRADQAMYRAKALGGNQFSR